MSTPYDAEWLEYDDATRPVTGQPLTPEQSATNERAIAEFLHRHRHLWEGRELAARLAALDAACAEVDRLREEVASYRSKCSCHLCLTVREALAGAGGETPK